METITISVELSTGWSLALFKAEHPAPLLEPPGSDSAAPLEKHSWEDFFRCQESQTDPELIVNGDTRLLGGSDWDKSKESCAERA